jgi:hypothetical protein
MQKQPAATVLHGYLGEDRHGRRQVEDVPLCLNVAPFSADRNKLRDLKAYHPRIHCVAAESAPGSMMQAFNA